MQKDDEKKPRSGRYGISTDEMLEHGNQMTADSGIPIQWEFSASKSMRTSLDRKSAVCPSCKRRMTPTLFDPKEFTSSRGIGKRYSRELVRDDFYEKVGPGECRGRVALVDARGHVAGHAEGAAGVQSIAQRKPAEAER